MGVLVAVVALRERDSLVARLLVGPRRVALLALHLLMLTSQRVASFRVIESRGNVFPVSEVVARFAFGSKAALVEVFVAGGAGCRDADKSAIEVFDLDQRAHIRRDALRHVALLAVDARVLSFEDVSRLFMVEGFRVPFDEREVLAIVIGVALHASLTGTGLKSVRGMQSLVRVESRSNFGVAVEAFEDRLAAQFVASCTTGGAFEILMGAGERPGGNLRRSCSTKQRDRTQDQASPGHGNGNLSKPIAIPKR